MALSLCPVANAWLKAVGFILGWVVVVELEEVLQGVYQITRHELRAEQVGTLEGNTWDLKAGF